MSRPRRVETVAIDGVVVPSGRRPLDEGALVNLIASMKRIGLQMPICVRPAKNVTDGDGVIYDAADVLVCGGHRLEAARRLGWETIEAFVEDIDEVDAELWEISENLHRAELTALQRSEQIDRWRLLTAEKVRKLSAPLTGGIQPKEMGYRKTATELGIDEAEVRASGKISSLSEDAKAAARETGLDDNRSALLKAAKSEPQRQATVIRDMAEAKASGRNKIDRDVAERAIREAASIIIEHVPAEYWDGLKANLYAGKCGALANEISNITGQSIMDRRFG